MKKFLLKLLKLIIPIIIVYLFISCIYIIAHISFHQYTEKEILSNMFSVYDNDDENLIRVIMGLPATSSNFKTVGPKYFWEVLIKCIIAFALFTIYPLINKKAKTSWYKLFIIFFGAVIIILSFVKYTEKIEEDLASEVRYNLSITTGNLTQTYEFEEGDTFNQFFLGGLGFEKNVKHFLSDKSILYPRKLIEIKYLRYPYVEFTFKDNYLFADFNTPLPKTIDNKDYTFLFTRTTPSRKSL